MSELIGTGDGGDTNTTATTTQQQQQQTTQQPPLSNNKPVRLLMKNNRESILETSPHVHHQQLQQKRQQQQQQQENSSHNNNTVDECNIFVKYLPSDMNDEALNQLFSQFGRILSCKVMIDTKTRTSLGYGFVRFSSNAEASRAIKQMNGFKLHNKTLLCKLSNMSQSVPNHSKSSSAHYHAIPSGTHHHKHHQQKSQYNLSGGMLPTMSPHMSAKHNPAPKSNNSGNNMAITIMPPHHLLSMQTAASSPTSTVHTAVESTNLYVKNLPLNYGTEQLRTLFQSYGTIMEANVMYDKDGVSRQIGFVRFEQLPDAIRAVKEMNGHQIQVAEDSTTTRLIVKFAETKTQKLQRKQRKMQKQQLQQSLHHPPSYLSPAAHHLHQPPPTHIPAAVNQFIPPQIFPANPYYPMIYQQAPPIPQEASHYQQDTRSVVMEEHGAETVGATKTPTDERHTSSDGDYEKPDLIKHSPPNTNNRSNPLQPPHNPDYYTATQPPAPMTLPPHHYGYAHPGAYMADPYSSYPPYPYAPNGPIYSHSPHHPAALSNISADLSSPISASDYRKPLGKNNSPGIGNTHNNNSNNINVTTSNNNNSSTNSNNNNGGNSTKFSSSGEDPNLFVFHLPSDVSDMTLFHLFSPFGSIESVKVISDRTSGESKGYGFVKYYHLESAVQAVSLMNGYRLGRKHLKVSFKTSMSSLSSMVSSSDNTAMTASEPTSEKPGSGGNDNTEVSEKKVNNKEGTSGTEETDKEGNTVSCPDETSDPSSVIVEKQLSSSLSHELNQHCGDHTLSQEQTEC